MKENVTVLICDDQHIIHDTLGEYFKVEGFTTISAFDGEEALTRFREKEPDMIVLDLMMPKLSGTEVCKEIRKNSRVPIIMLTARGEEIERILGLELGADDYIVKPFSPREVVARVRAVLRRIGEQQDSNEKTILRFNNLEINIGHYEVRASGNILPFTPKEVEVLYLLASQPGRVLNREQILSQVWGYDYYGDTRVVDTQIKRIRQKLPENPYWMIRSIYGVGYKFEVGK